MACLRICSRGFSPKDKISSTTDMRFTYERIQSDHSRGIAFEKYIYVHILYIYTILNRYPNTYIENFLIYQKSIPKTEIASHKILYILYKRFYSIFLSITNFNRNASYFSNLGYIDIHRCPILSFIL